jgi:hypothetical protein
MHHVIIKAVTEYVLCSIYYLVLCNSNSGDTSKSSCRFKNRGVFKTGKFITKEEFHKYYIM